MLRRPARLPPQGLLTDKGVATPFDELDPLRTRTVHFAGTRKGSRHGGPGAELLVFGEEGALARLRAVAAAASLSLAELAIAWLLARPAVACVLVGASRPEQARRNAVVPKVAAATLAQVDDATAALLAELLAQGAPVDQYARESRIHGNAAAESAAQSS